MHLGRKRPPRADGHRKHHPRAQPPPQGARRFVRVSQLHPRQSAPLRLNRRSLPSPKRHRSYIARPEHQDLLRGRDAENFGSVGPGSGWTV